MKVTGSLRRIGAKLRGRSIGFLIWKICDEARRTLRGRLPYRLAYREARQTACLISQAGARGLASYLIRRREPTFFVDQEDAAKVAAWLAAADEGYLTRLTSAADAIARCQIPVLAGAVTPIDEPVDWHRDYISDLGWAPVRARKIDYIDPGRPTDVRVVWELNRLHFLATLGRAYRAGGEERHARAVVELVADWDQANPVGRGVNWTCAMEAAIRSVSLIWAVTLVLPSPSVHDQFLRRLVRMLLEHGAFIRHNLEYSDIRNNHYVADLVGLIWIGLFLPEVPTADAWLRFALPRFEVEIFEQTYEDGCSHEGSIPYHRLATELFLLTALLLERNGHELSDSFWTRLEKMADFLAAYTKPDGSCPIFGDSDDGRLQVLGDQDVNDHRYLLAVAAWRFQRSDLAAAAGRLWEEAAWALGPDALVDFTALSTGAPPQASRAFRGGGWFFLRSGESYVAVDCGDVGLRGRGGHGHCDALSIEMALQGSTVVVDRGCSSYTSSRQRREEVIVAASHNVVIVDDEDFAVVSPHEIPSVAPMATRLVRWSDGPDGTLFEGEHNGYGSRGVVHRRTIRVDARSGAVHIADDLRGHGTRRVRTLFHLTPGSEVEHRARACRITTADGVGVTVRNTSPETGSWELHETIVYPSYRRASPAKRLEWRTSVQLPFQMVFDWIAEAPRRPAQT